jgi:hypothetical protein
MGELVKHGQTGLMHWGIDDQEISSQFRKRGKRLGMFTCRRKRIRLETDISG